MATHVINPAWPGLTLCNKFIPAGQPAGTLERGSSLGPWPDVRIAANQRRPSCPRCMRKVREALHA